MKERTPILNHMGHTELTERVVMDTTLQLHCNPRQAYQTSGY